MTLWLAYIAAAVLVLAVKLGRYIYQNRTRPRLEVLAEWFFDSGSADNAASWVGTIGVVWTLGYLYIGEICTLIPGLPVHPSVAFLLGALAEFIAPAVAKIITSTVIRLFEKTTGATQ